MFLKSIEVQMAQFVNKLKLDNPSWSSEDIMKATLEGFDIADKTIRGKSRCLVKEISKLEAKKEMAASRRFSTDGKTAGKEFIGLMEKLGVSCSRARNAASESDFYYIGGRGPKKTLMMLENHDKGRSEFGMLTTPSAHWRRPGDNWSDTDAGQGGWVIFPNCTGVVQRTSYDLKGKTFKEVEEMLRKIDGTNSF